MDISAQKYKIWINASWLILITPDQFKKMDFKGMPMVCLLQSPSIAVIAQHMLKMISGQLEIPVIVTTVELTVLWRKLIKKTPLVYAAGGIVQRPDGKYLFIHRRGWWDLPKGKLDKGETNKKAALREVKEEVGLDCKIRSALPNTFHGYLDRGILVIKETAWYMMTTEQTKPVLQSEEGIINHKWVSKAGISKIKPKLYANLQILVDAIDL